MSGYSWSPASSTDQAFSIKKMSIISVGNQEFSCPSVCVCDRCGRGRNEFAGRVQNHHVRFSFHRNGHFLR